MTEHEKKLAMEYWSHTVPKRLLDEEKKNTMENLAKEEEQIKRLPVHYVAENTWHGTKFNPVSKKYVLLSDVLEIIAASGSVAAPKERSQHEDELQSEWERGYKIGKHESDNDHEAIKEFIEEVYNSLYVGPDLEDKEIMQHYIDVFKIIKERAKAILDKH